MNYKSKQILKLWVKLNRATQTLSKSNELIFKENDLSTAQFGILDALFHKGCANVLGNRGEMCLFSINLLVILTLNNCAFYTCEYI